MLQPRLPLRRICDSCQKFGQTAKRSYAQVVVDTKTPQQSIVGQTTISSLPDNAPILNSAEVNLRRYTARTPGLRHLIRPVNDHIWKGRPVHELTFPKKGHAKGGRNKTGRITVRHRGGGAKRRIRTVDFYRAEPGQHLVERIEHDPGRSAHIALIRSFKTKERSYILAAEGLRAGDVVNSYRAGIPKELLADIGGNMDMGIIASRTAFKGNCLKLGMIPVGTPIFNIAPDKDSFAKLARCAGTHGIILSKGEDTVQKEMAKSINDGATLDLSALSQAQLRKFEKAANYVTVKLSSGEIRLIDKEAFATVGIASNANFKYRSLGKAGRKRWLGIRPTVRGTAMNAVDHPHGGGRGKSKGNKIPVSPWGVPTKSGYKTRSKDKVNKLIVQERPRNHGKRRRAA